MRSKLYLLTLVLVLCAIGGTAFAQWVEFDTDQPLWNARIGAAWMMGDTPDDVELLIGLSYETPLEEGFSRSWMGFSVDYIPVSTAGILIVPPDGGTGIREGEGTVSVVPLLVYLKRMGLLGGYRVWASVGAGVRYADDDIPEMQITDRWGFAWTLGAGVDFTRDFFGQVRYIAGENPGDDGILSTEIGWRF